MSPKSAAQRLKHLRLQLDWSQLHMGQELGLEGDAGSIRARVHQMEIESRPVTGPISKLVEKIAAEHSVNLDTL